jgi:hypothetical protein
VQETFRRDRDRRKQLLQRQADGLFVFARDATAPAAILF